MFKFTLTLFLLHCCDAFGLLSTLPTLNISEVSVSGLSSGAFFAVQFHIAHSSLVVGAASFAGGPYYCARSSLALAEEECMNARPGPSVQLLVDYTREASAMGTIDNVRHLEAARTYIFSGTLDTVVDNSVGGKALEQFYHAFLKTNGSMSTELTLPAEHCLPTLDYGVPCDVEGSPFLGKCQYDGAYWALRALLLHEGQSLQRGVAMPDNLISFDQRTYAQGLGPMCAGDEGFLYLPEACKDGTKACHLHVSFHGCKQNVELIGDTYATRAGFNEYAEKNNMVVLYPYVSACGMRNPKGCWDWWGYTNDLYGLKAGKQMQFIRRMITSLSGR
jgi:hypothetical protein